MRQSYRGIKKSHCWSMVKMLLLSLSASAAKQQQRDMPPLDGVIFMTSRKE